MSRIEVDESDRANEHFVGETRALNKKLRQAIKKTKHEVAFEFNDEDELFAAEETLNKEFEKENELIANRIAYQMYWGNRKKEQVLAHIARGCYNPCRPTSQRDWSCGLCKCGRGEFKCLCDSGRKMLSPYKIVFINSAEAAFQRSKIWELGVGYVPKKTREIAPDWRSVNWN